MASTSFDYLTWSYRSLCGLITESVLYGIYIALFSYAIRQLWFRDNDRTHARLMTLFTLMLMFLMSTTLWTLDIVDSMRGQKEVFLNPNGTIDERADEYQKELNTRIIVQTTIFSAEYLIGDTVVAWRACALWGYSKKVMFLPVLFLTSATVLISFFVGCLGKTNWAFLEGESKTCANAYLGVFFLSIATNVVATSLIAAKAWMHHRLLLSASAEQKSRVMKVLVLLVESGFIYLLIWAAKSMGAFGNLPEANAQFTVNMLNMMGNQIVGLYPTLLVILVRMQLSAFKAAEVERYNNWGKSVAAERGNESRRMEDGMIFASPTETLAVGTSTTSSWPTNLTLLGSEAAGESHPS
ncbi:hypothetical protein GYMLUDRAFT_78125 [Collybiopsis luxurians FD-317 M1]|uniref:Uncharacterized protein n=1 Tax=Collybiopsis luxurians FD-317 M1 TaxID=944289 RepID=A0A0D0BPT9_9AGAR|nr:hypothetical protein GYMLUDRAFT_78125 [Collybiopsis luxurians FD-317 M1]